MTHQRQESTKHTILAAALRRFLHYGPKKTTMQEVAKDAGVAVGTLYLYFKSKDDLIIGCAELFAEEHRERAALQASSTGRADRKLRRYVRERYHIWQEVGIQAPHAEELAQAILRLRPKKTEEVGEDFERHVAAILAEGRDSGVFPHVLPERDARVLMLSLGVFFPVAGQESPLRPSERDLEMVLDWFIDRFRGEAK